MPFLRWPRRKDAPKGPDGLSIETAFPVHAGDSATAIMLEYRALERLFGRMNHDWKLQNRCVLRASDGRAIEKFTIGTRGNRAEVFFDISSWYGKDSEQQTKRIVEEVIGRSSHENLSITLPAGDLLALTTLLMVKGRNTITRSL